MSHDRLLAIHSNRPASRRLHRRLALPALLACAPSGRFASNAPRTLLPLSDAIIHKAGMLELVAAEMRIAELEKSLADARAAATTDPLTGALNRRGFEKVFRREFARAHRTGAGLALALIDLDDFKRLNDVHGHHAGDQALVHLVRVLRAAMRPSDVISRFGGEEFVLLLPDTDLPNAEAALARFQRGLAEQPLPNKQVVMTFSAGLVLQQAGESLEDSIQRADKATYAAKRAGKNCVMTA